MPGFKLGRLSEDVKKELCVVFAQLKDPRVSKMLSIIKLNLTNDLSFCTVYVSAIEGEDITKTSIEGLKAASGFIRKEIAQRLHMRKTPQFIFVADDSIAYSAKINKILEDINEDKE
ncbi:MAG: 30S ribosome-binding factor RbfA [Oscillospiraceae bacterium]